MGAHAHFSIRERFSDASREELLKYIWARRDAKELLLLSKCFCHLPQMLRDSFKACGLLPRPHPSAPRGLMHQRRLSIDNAIRATQYGLPLLYHALRHTFRFHLWHIKRRPKHQKAMIVDILMRMAWWTSVLKRFSIISSTLMMGLVTYKRHVSTPYINVPTPPFAVALAFHFSYTNSWISGLYRKSLPFIIEIRATEQYRHAMGDWRYDRARWRRSYWACALPPRLQRKVRNDSSSLAAISDFRAGAFTIRLYRSMRRLHGHYDDSYFRSEPPSLPHLRYHGPQAGCATDRIWDSMLRIRTATALSETRWSAISPFQPAQNTAAELYSFPHFRLCVDIRNALEYFSPDGNFSTIGFRHLLKMIRERLARFSALAPSSVYAQR